MSTGCWKYILSACWRSFLVISIAVVLALGPYKIEPSRAADINLLVDSHLDSNDPAYQVCSDAPGDCSLRGAISQANANPDDHYTILIPGGIYPIDLPGGSEDDNNTGDLDIKGWVTLDGEKYGVFLSGNQLDRVLHVHPAARVTIINLDISGGKSPDGIENADGEPGGGIFNQGSLSIQNSVIHNNQAGNGSSATPDLEARGGGSGGGVLNEGDLTIENSLLNNNLAGTGGEGIDCITDEAYYPDCGDCRASGDGGYGGGIFNSGSLTIDNTSLISNTTGSAGLPGECTVFWGGFPLLVESFPGLDGWGGGIVNQSVMSLSASTIQGNNGLVSGGGLRNQGWAYLFETSISDNKAIIGGGVSNQEYIEIEDSYVFSNTSNSGGGIYNDGELHILNTTVNENAAMIGGGIYNNQGLVFFTGGAVQNNWTWDGPAGSDEWCCDKAGDVWPPTGGGSPPGGGIYNDGTMHLDHSLVSGNFTGNGGNGGQGGETNAGANGGDGGYGAGIFNAGVFDLNDTLVISNTTGNGGEMGYGYINGEGGDGGYGGGVYNAGTMTLILSQVSGNSTGAGYDETCPGGNGGGIANEGILTFSLGKVANNQTGSKGDGGGIYTSQPLTITSSTVLSNTAGGGGGGLFADGGTINATNNIIAHNAIGSGSEGSGIYLSSTIADLLHTTLAQNIGGDGSGIEMITTTLAMTNTILVSHTIGISVALGANATLESTLWGDGMWANETDLAGSGSIITGTQNYWLEPGFVDPANLDYHIISSSLAIDGGIPAGIDIDVDNQPRPNPTTSFPDIGADEYWDFIPVSEVTLSGPVTGFTYDEIVLNAAISPTLATPNILFYWTPPPISGQWTDTVTYVWTRPGLKTIDMTAIQANSLVTATFTITLEAATRWLFLPIVSR